MKTWEMIKELTENPEKKFKEKSFGQVEMFKGYLVQSSNMDIIVINKDILEKEWEEVKEPVSFIDVLRSGKKVMIKHQDIDGELSYMSETYNDIDDVMYNISNYFTAEGVREILLNGEWYIENE